MAGGPFVREEEIRVLVSAAEEEGGGCEGDVVVEEGLLLLLFVGVDQGAEGAMPVPAPMRSLGGMVSEEELVVDVVVFLGDGLEVLVEKRPSVRWITLRVLPGGREARYRVQTPSRVFFITVLYLTIATRSSNLVPLLFPSSESLLCLPPLAILNCLPLKSGKTLMASCQGILALSNSCRISRIERRGRVA